MVPAVCCKLVACFDPYVYAISHPRFRYAYDIFYTTIHNFSDFVELSCKRGFLAYSPASTNQNLLKKPQQMLKLLLKMQNLKDFERFAFSFATCLWVIALCVPSVIWLAGVFQVE